MLNIFSDSFITFFCLKQENMFLEEIVQLIVIFKTSEFVVFAVVCIFLFWCSCLEAPLCTTICMTVKHVFEGNLTCLTKLLNCFPLFFFIMFPQSFLIWIASALVHPNLRSLLSLTMEKMCLATTFIQWEGSSRKDGSGIHSSSFPLYDLRT